MSWFSFSRKNKLEPAPDESEFYSHAEDIPATSRRRGKAKEEAIDPVLPEKKRARRRLVGAVAITLGLVIVLPMVLDSEPKSNSGEVVIQIPSRDKLAKLAASRPTASAFTPSTTEKNTETPSPSVAAAETGKPAGSDAPADKPAPVKAAPEPAKLVRAETKNSDAKPAAETAQAKVLIQVAALASQEKVDELRARLTKEGFKSQTQKVATKDGDRIRVRVGPFASKDQAEKACPKLSKMKLNCTVVSN
jgi:DedD protein